MTEAGSQFWQASPDYHGVLKVAPPYRLAVSPNGKRYILQDEKGGPVLKHRKMLCLLLDDLPDNLRQWAQDNLPDDPSEVPRSWETSMRQLGEARASVNARRDGYAGVIACNGQARLAVSPTLKTYMLQVRGPSGEWTTARSARSMDGVWSVVMYSQHPESDLAAFARKPAFMSVLPGLPHRPSNVGGKIAKRLAEARKAQKVVRGSRKALTELHGPHIAAQAQSD